jgi:predicted transcriptional regulator
MTKIIHECNYTAIPNIIFDYWMHKLDHATFKIIFLMSGKTILYPVGYQYLTEKTGLTKNTVYKSIKILLSKDLIREKKPYDQEIVVEYLKSRISERTYSKLTENSFCSWCQCDTSILHKHHYPIPKKDKGKLTVDICANCHSEFHYLTESRFFEVCEELKGKGGEYVSQNI